MRVDGPVDDPIGETMHKVTANLSSAIIRGPDRRLLADSLHGATDLAEELSPEPLRTFLVPRAGVFEFFVYIRMNVNGEHRRSAANDL